MARRAVNPHGCAGLTVPPVLPTAGVPQGVLLVREWGAPPPTATPPDPPVACAFRVIFPIRYRIYETQHRRNGSIRTGGDVLAARPKSETLSTGMPVSTASSPGSWPATTSSGRWTPSRTTSPSSILRPRRARRREAPRLLPLRPPPGAGSPGDRRGGPPPAPRRRVRDLHRPDPQGDRGGGQRRLLRLRLPVGPGRRLVQRPDAGQLLHGHLPLPLRDGDVHLLRPAAGRPLVRRRLLHPRHDADPDRRLPARQADVHPPAEGRPAFLPDDVPPACPGREGVPARHRERRPVGGPGGPLEAARGRRPADAGPLGPQVPPGAGAIDEVRPAAAPGGRRRRSSAGISG